MHVSPLDLQAVRQDGIMIRFATLGSMAYVLGEFPDSGSHGTSAEKPCVRPHWAMVIAGELTFVTARRRQAIPAGSIFHVPAGGPEHHFVTPGAALVAGFEPIETDLDVSDERLIEQGFEIVSDSGAAPIVPQVGRRRIAPGQVSGESWRMTPFVMGRVRMGERTGYTSGWCDAEHWGIVTEGRLAIEWEDDIEILSKGDIFHCPAGPPGHRIEAADPATFIELTPIAAMSGGGRLAEWRGTLTVETGARSRGIAVAALG